MTPLQDVPQAPLVEVEVPLTTDTQPGAAFFQQVDAVLAILREDGGLLIGPEEDQQSQDPRGEAIAGLTSLCVAWEPVVVKLTPFPVEVLEYVARMCRAREGTVNRRATTILGSARGAGLLGIILASFAVTAPFGTIKVWFPDTPGWLVLVSAFAGICIVIGVGTGVLSGAHPVSHLIYYADAIDAVVALKKGERSGIES